MRREVENDRVWWEKCGMHHEQLWWDSPVPQERWEAWVNVDISQKVKSKETWYDRGRFEAGDFGDMMKWPFRILELWECQAFVELPTLTTGVGWPGKEVKSCQVAAWKLKKGRNWKYITLGRLQEGSETVEPAWDFSCLKEIKTQGMILELWAWGRRINIVLSIKAEARRSNMFVSWSAVLIRILGVHLGLIEKGAIDNK